MTGAEISAPAPAPASPPLAGAALWRKRALRAALPASYACAAAILLAAASRFATQNPGAAPEKHVVAWFVSALFVGIAVPLSVGDILSHLLHFVSPLQRLYIRILWLVPIFAVDAWLALRFKDEALFINTARECYEAFVIFSFFSLLVEFLGPRERTLQLLAAKALRSGRAHAHMLLHFCHARPWRLDALFLDRTRLGTFQYVVVRLVLSAAIFVGSWTGSFVEGAWTDFDGLFVWSVIILNFSQLVAMWSLVMFFHELSEELAPLNPLYKFLSVKMIVFFSFWQKIIISGLSFAGVIKPTLDWTKADIGTGLADFLICIEMALAAAAHRRFFSSRDFWRGEGDETAPLRVALQPGARPGKLIDGLVAMLPGDVIVEAAAHTQSAKAAVAGALATAVGRGRAADPPAAGATEAPAAKLLAVAPVAAQDW